MNQAKQINHKHHKVTYKCTDYVLCRKILCHACEAYNDGDTIYCKECWKEYKAECEECKKEFPDHDMYFCKCMEMICEDCNHLHQHC